MFDAMNVAILIGAALVAAAAFTSLLSFRFGAPLLLIFLLVGLLAGEDGLGIEFDNLGAAYFVGSVALAIILFDSGYATRLAALRVAALPALALATVGVLVTALLVGLAARVLFGFSWLQGLLLGVIVAPTDAAAVFFLLRVGGITLRDLVRSTLEVESGSNDPIAIFLTVALVAAFAMPPGLAGLGVEVLAELALQLVIGGLVGLAGGVVIVQAVNRTNFEPALYPIVVTALALMTYAAAGLVYGSGFLAVYVAGLVSGNAAMRHAAALRRFQEGTTWLAQIAMFLTLGLLATPSEFSLVAAPAIGLAAFLILVARPAAVWLCLLPFRFTRHEMAFVSWVGLRGAVSILLAILPAIGDVPGGRTMFNAAFVVVLASLLVQGWTIAPMARLLGLVVPPRRGPLDRIELGLPGTSQHEVVAYLVHPESAVAKGERIPRWARPSLVVRDGRALRPPRFGRPEAGDRVYVITTPEYLNLLDKLFSGPAPGLDDPDLYGEFLLQPDTRLAEVARAYPIAVTPSDGALTVGDFLRRELAGDIEAGDRLALGDVDLIVRRVSDDHAIEEIGLAMEHAAEARPRIPLFQSPRELVQLWRDWLARRRIPPAPPPGA
ncbi:MAG: potassium/proton antiporter [Bauldia sp.]